MNFKGYLLKINSKTLPLKFIASYKSTPNQIMDLDSYRDANGILHRNPLSHLTTKIEISTPPLWLTDKIELQGYISSRIKTSLEYWNDETNSYKTGVFYIPDLDFELYQTTSNNIKYLPIRIAFIEY